MSIPLTRDRRPRIEATLPNIIAAIDSQVRVVDGCISIAPDWRPLTDTDMVALRETLGRVHGFKPVSKRRMREAIRMLAAKGTS